MHEDQKDGHTGDDYLVPHHFGERVDGAVDEVGPVVGWNDADVFGQARLQVLNLGLDALCDSERVFPVSHEHDAADDFVAVLLQDVAAKLRADLNYGHGPDIDRRAAHLFDDDVLDIAQRLDPADAANQVFGVVLLNDPSADGRVAARHGVIEFAQRDVISTQFAWIDVDLVFERLAASEADLGDARHRVQFRRDVELVEGPQPAGVEIAAFEGIPVDLSDGRGIRSQIRHHSRRHECRGQRQLLQHSLAREIVIDVIVEDDRDHREVEFRRRANVLDACQSLQFQGERIGDLFLDLARAAAHPIGEDDHLVFTQVRNRVDRRIKHGIDRKRRQSGGEEHYQIAIANRMFDEGFDHDGNLHGGRVVFVRYKKAASGDGATWSPLASSSMFPPAAASQLDVPRPVPCIPRNIETRAVP